MSTPTLEQIQASLARRDSAATVAMATALLAVRTLPPLQRLNALLLRSRAHELVRDFGAAIADLDAALAIDPRQPRLWNELGILCGDAGDSTRAIDAFSRATALDPGYARAFNNLGNALRAAGRVPEAVVATQRAVAVDPAYALAWSNLGTLCRESGDDAKAEAALRRTLELDPRVHAAWIGLGGLLRDRSDLASAAECFMRAVSLDARDANACFQLGGTLAERDDLTGARASYAAALERDPRLLRAAIAVELALPMLADGVDEVTSARAHYDEGLARLETALPERARVLAPDRLHDELRWTNFLLAYQGHDDRELQSRYGALVTRVLASGAPQTSTPPSPRPRTGRVRVGFVSTFFRDGTAGRYFERWITDLPRDRFEVVAYHLLPGIDPLAARIAQRADRFVHMPWWRPSQAAPVIRDDALDVLVYPELGMGAVPFALAASRLAPVQCAGWGHPVTSGLPAIDVYFSCAAMEPPDAQAHYTERLVLLPGIGTRYRAPVVPPDASRATWGLPEGVPLLLCPQSLFKIHPDNDALFARVLAAVPAARLVVFEGRDAGLTRRFVARLARAGIGAERLQVLQQCGHDDFLRINRVCDVMLDTLHWSGGNTSLDALACGLPLVTLPGRFMRGRQSAAMLAMLGLPELVAGDQDDYVRIAAAVATAPAERTRLSARIVDAQGELFDASAPVEAFAQRLLELVDHA